MKTKDGVEFKLGMTVYRPDFDDSEDLCFSIDEIETTTKYSIHDKAVYYCYPISKLFDIPAVYAIRKNAIPAVIEMIEGAKKQAVADLQEQIDEFQEELDADLL